jgi:hypothetical protein
LIEEVGKSKPASSISLPELHGRATPRERVLVVAEGGGEAFAWWPGALEGCGEGLAASDFVPQRQRQGHPPGKLLG